MTEAVTKYDAGQGAILEQVVIGGDLSKLSPGQRVDYYRQVCESLGLNPLTRPFQYITLNGKLTLYASRDCTDQLRRSRGVSISNLVSETINDIYIVKATAVTPEGHTDTSTGAVSIKNLSGDALANALMKAETKAKRRVTLSIVGLGWLDETEADTIPSARLVNVNTETGELPPAKSLEQYVDAGIGPSSVQEKKNRLNPATDADLTEPRASTAPAPADEFEPYTEMPAGAGGRAITMQDVLGRVRDYEGQCKSMAINFPAAPADDAPILDWANYAKRLAWLIKQAGGL